MKNHKKSIKKFFFKDQSFAFEFIRTLGASTYQGADIGECLIAASNIKDGNFESWYNEWYAMAEKIHAVAADCRNRGHTESAKMAYLRASSYYRTADFYLHGNKNDPRINETSHKSRDCFFKFIQLEQIAEQVKIPYEGTYLPGYFYSPYSKERPTIIIQTGFDGTQEELYLYALEGIKRGYNVLTFEGPGQGAVIREQKLPFRADWEKVVTPVIDYLATRPDVDKDMIILYGLSYGGYMAPRAASFDQRIKILVANGGIFDPVTGILKNFKVIAKTKEDLLSFIKKHPTLFNSIVYMVMRFKTNARWFFEHGMYSFNVQTPAELILRLAEWTMHNHAQNITSTTLICDVDNEMLEIAGQAHMLYNQLTCPKKLITFMTEDGAGYHCQMGALLTSNQVIFDWIDATVSLLTQEQKWELKNVA